MSVYEQTVVLLERTTGFTFVCQACVELEPNTELPLVTVRGTLRLERDVGWTSCPRGHRIRVVRAGAAVAAEATTPLW
jgi:hypothetical protein